MLHKMHPGLRVVIIGDITTIKDDTFFHTQKYDAPIKIVIIIISLFNVGLQIKM